MKITINFYECEHDGDLSSYINDIVLSGGKIKYSEPNFEAEIAEVIVEVDDITVFIDTFCETDACDFSQYQHYKKEKIKRDLETLKQELHSLLEPIEAKINTLPYKGDKCSDSQKICLIQALYELEHNINGLEKEDLIEEKEL
jgi:hypothetical protein